MLLAGCANGVIRNPVPTARAETQAAIPHIPGARVWGDASPDNVAVEFRKRAPHAPKLGKSAPIVAGRSQIEILALSGGGPDGAFGAGVLAGWTARGDRPVFEHVTGVSAGAIIAPLAFLGPDYDEELKEIWTAYNTDELVTPQFVAGLLGGDALVDTKPLRELIKRYVDADLMKKIAREYKRGRYLTIGTTNLDAKRPVVWNMGEIAAQGTPQSLELFRDVILASAAIPGLFPPVNIKVAADGKVYDELHVDGGVTRQIYVTPVNLPFEAFDALYEKPPQRYVYLIQNGKMDPEYEPVDQKTLPIATQSIYTLLLSQHRGDIYRIYRMTKDSGADFNTLAVPTDFEFRSKEKFDVAYQKALYQRGFDLGRRRAWAKAPPDVPKPDRFEPPANGHAPDSNAPASEPGATPAPGAPATEPPTSRNPEPQTQRKVTKLEPTAP